MLTWKVYRSCTLLGARVKETIQMDPSVSQSCQQPNAGVQCTNTSRLCKLSYVKSAYGITDTPDSVPELISQRRRWLNGSFFAAIHATVKFGYIYRSDHSFIRKFWLHIELVYQLFQQLFAWFSLANYYISFVSCFPNSFQALLLYVSILKCTYSSSILTVNPHSFTRRLFFWPRMDEIRQYCATLHLSWSTHHVLPPLYGQHSERQ